MISLIIVIIILYYFTFYFNCQFELCVNFKKIISFVDFDDKMNFFY